MLIGAGAVTARDGAQELLTQDSSIGFGDHGRRVVQGQDAECRIGGWRLKFGTLSTSAVRLVSNSEKAARQNPFCQNINLADQVSPCSTLIIVKP